MYQTLAAAGAFSTASHYILIQLGRLVQSNNDNKFTSNSTRAVIYSPHFTALSQAIAGRPLDQVASQRTPPEPMQTRQIGRSGPCKACCLSSGAIHLRDKWFGSPVLGFGRREIASF